MIFRGRGCIVRLLTWDLLSAIEDTQLISVKREKVVINELPLLKDKLFLVMIMF